METMQIAPARLCGRIRVPSSKSLAHRAVIAASLCPVSYTHLDVYKRQPYPIGGKVRLYVGEPIELAAALPETLKGAQRIEAANKLLETSVQTLKDRAEL